MTNKTDDKSQTPPWGDDENFDAEKAWSLIVNLRTERDGLKAEKATAVQERDALQAEKDAAATEGQSEADKATAKAQKDADDLASARKELWVERALRKHNVPEDLMEFLSGDDEDAILAKAAKLAGLPAKPSDEGDKDADKDKDKPEPMPGGRPKPALTPGHGGDENVFDPDAIVAANFG